MVVGLDEVEENFRLGILNQHLRPQQRRPQRCYLWQKPFLHIFTRLKNTFFFLYRRGDRTIVGEKDKEGSVSVQESKVDDEGNLISELGRPKKRLCYLHHLALRNA